MRYGVLCEDKGRTQVHFVQQIEVFDGGRLDVAFRERADVAPAGVQSPKRVDGPIDRLAEGSWLASIDHATPTGRSALRDVMQLPLLDVKQPELPASLP